MGNSYPPDYQLPIVVLDRYLAGVATADDAEAVGRWVAADPRHAPLANQPFASQHDAANTAMAWERLAPRVAMSNDGSEPSLTVHREGAGRPKRVARRSPGTAGLALRRWVIAAATAGVVGTAIVVGWPALSRVVSPRPAVRQLATAKGQRATIELSDGTRIVLGVDSRLWIPADFGVQNRTITLDGEALFDVTQHTGSPFLVQTANASTRVLGTTFAVRQYRGEPSTAVTVMSGKVSLERAVITAGQQGVRRLDGSIVVQAVSGNEGTAWINGSIAFDHVPLRDVVIELNRWFDVQFVIDDPKLANELVTINLRNRSPEEAAAVLDEILKIRHRRSAGQIFLAR
jgi:ferric-dicitrate binding protein FerR (iron transport regulator)